MSLIASHSPQSWRQVEVGPMMMSCQPRGLPDPLVLLHGEDSGRRRGHYHDFTPFALAMAAWKTLSSLARKPVLLTV